jgi:RNA polymerase sigma-70 factor (ECF subfamily)
MKSDDNIKITNLVERAKSGDRRAYSELVRLKMNQVVAFTYRMTQDKDSALDLAQETFLAAWESLGSYRGDAQFSTWLHRIAANKTLNYLKKSSRTVSLGDAADETVGRTADASAPDAQMQREQLRRHVLDFMGTLPEQQRLAFDLRFYKEHSFDEIASITGRAVGTVKTNYREAVKKLREFAREKGWR